MVRSLIIGVLNLYRARFRIDYLRNSGSTLRPCLIWTYLHRQLGAKVQESVQVHLPVHPPAFRTIQPFGKAKSHLQGCALR